jgi:hypothetical protein
MSERPWLILTLRRTGGTSLTSFLSTISGFPTVEHEPFNPDRAFGHINRAFQADEDAEAMTKSIRLALKDIPNIKHCVEVVPMELTRALIDIGNELGYRLMVLTRRDEAKRLASLFLAVATESWGPKAAQKNYPLIVAGEKIPTPIDMKSVRDRVRTDFFSIGRTLSLLRNRQIDYPWYLFEELYFGDVSLNEQVRGIADDLGLTIAEDDVRLLALSESSGQKSHEIAPYVENYGAMVVLLNKMCII